MSNVRQQFWVIIPAAGVGRRAASDVPKQYLKLLDRTVIEWSLAPFLMCDWIAGIIVALSRDDDRWPSLAVSRDARIQTTLGGDERAQTVALAMQMLASRAAQNDWVLVHDAARPCLRIADLQKLKHNLEAHPVGGLLATRVTDTLKQATADGEIEATISRENVWRAQTPQMFRFKLLSDALQATHTANNTVTDEASAVQLLRFRPQLIAGSADNIKITVPDDFQLAEQILRARVETHHDR